MRIRPKERQVIKPIINTAHNLSELVKIEFNSLLFGLGYFFECFIDHPFSNTIELVQVFGYVTTQTRGVNPYVNLVTSSFDGITGRLPVVPSLATWPRAL